jgi:hypothetical protein
MSFGACDASYCRCVEWLGGRGLMFASVMCLREGSCLSKQTIFNVRVQDLKSKRLIRRMRSVWGAPELPLYIRCTV